MANFTHQGRLKSLPDIAKTWLFELYINLPPAVDTPLNTNELLLRVRNAQLPGYSQAPIESFFMSTKSFYPGKVEIEPILAVTFEEFEDQAVMQTFDNWKNTVLNYRTGIQGGETKRDITSDIILKMYKADNTKLPKAIKFFNAWPQAIAAVDLSYDSSESLKIPISFQFDFYELVTSN